MVLKIFLLHILLKDGECVCRTSENCKSLVLLDKCNIEIIKSPDKVIRYLLKPYTLEIYFGSFFWRPKGVEYFIIYIADLT